MVAGALMTGAKNRDFDAIHDQLESVGADLDIGAGRHRATFTGKALAEDLSLALNILADCLRAPTFPRDHFERQRGERLTGLRYREQDTQWQGRRAFRRALYPEPHPYHYSTVGELNTVPDISRDQIAAFHARHYGPSNMILAMVGAVDTDAALELAVDAFGDWSNPDQPVASPLPPVEPPAQTRRESITVPGKSQADAIIGTIGPSRFAPDYRAATLANSILGQFGMMGRVGESVREREGMAYYAGSSLEGGFGPGAWVIGAGVDPGNVERAINLSVAEIRRLIEEPVSADELSDNQSYFTGRLPLQLESNGGVAATLHMIENYSLGLDYLLSYRDDVYAVTIDDIQAAASAYLNPDALVITVAGPD